MKTNQSLIGGRLIASPRIYATYARYFVKFIKAYRREGVPIYAVAVQNEPQNRNQSGYPGAAMPVAQEAKLINELGPRLRRAGLRTKIFGYDHNWAEHPNDRATPPPAARPPTRAGRTSPTPRPRPPSPSPAPGAGSPAPRSTATRATRSGRPRSTTR